MSIKATLPMGLLLLVVVVQDPVSGVPGDYFSTGILTNKWIPYYFKKIKARNQKECHNKCVQDSLCNAYAISEFERWCVMYNITVGNVPVKNTGYNLYVKRRTEAEGFYLYGTQYIRFMTKQRKNGFEAREICTRNGGRLPSVRKQDLNDMLMNLLIKHSVWDALIGVSDFEKEGDWKYEEGDPVGFTNWHWRGMWPRNDLNCAIITIDGTWKHTNCWAQNYFFCQIPIF
ncbi:collectin-10-like [Panulirus ornatus]|uniref:collectin-10-like n=1 Tax=Panulirus ornatus TaxID=150431 RepID=UPI003A8433FA